MGEMRDLFVEHSSVLFDVLKGIGEAAVQEAEHAAIPRFHHASGCLANAPDASVLTMLREHYKDQSLRLRRDEGDQTFEVSHRCFACGKRHASRINETSMAWQLTWDGAAEYLFRKIDELLASPCPNMEIVRGA